MSQIAMLSGGRFSGLGAIRAPVKHKKDSTGSEAITQADALKQMTTEAVKASYTRAKNSTSKPQRDPVGGFNINALTTEMNRRGIDPSVTEMKKGESEIAVKAEKTVEKEIDVKEGLAPSVAEANAAEAALTVAPSAFPVPLWAMIAGGIVVAVFALKSGGLAGMGLGGRRRRR